MKTAWVLLLLAGVMEISMAVFLKQSHGWTRLWPSIMGVVSAALSLLFLTLAIKDLPMSTAYAVWTGIGAIGAALIGIIWFKEDASPGRLLFIIVIVVGIAGLQFYENREQHPPEPQPETAAKQ